MVRTLIPDDLRDFLSILSFIGFIAIFFKFALGNPILSNVMEALFLVIAGTGLLVLGKVFSIHKWARDGIQANETLQTFAVIFGLASTIVGMFLLFNINIPVRFQGFVGLLALFPAVFILLDYLTKNKIKF